MQAFQTSAFSLKALAAALSPLMPSGASIVGLDFDATVAWPIYDWMGVAKAALESVSRYLARDLGPHGDPSQPGRGRTVGTVAARGIPGFETLADLWQRAGAAGVGRRGPLARGRHGLLPPVRLRASDHRGDPARRRWLPRDRGAHLTADGIDPRAPVAAGLRRRVRRPQSRVGRRLVRGPPAENCLWSWRDPPRLPARPRRRST